MTTRHKNQKTPSGYISNTINLKDPKFTNTLRNSDLKNNFKTQPFYTKKEQTSHKIDRICPLLLLKEENFLAKISADFNRSRLAACGKMRNFN